MVLFLSLFLHLLLSFLSFLKMPILTAGIGDNSDIFPRITQLYIPEGSTVLDMTWGRGVFWKKIDQSKYNLVRNDMDNELGDTHFDFRNTTFNDKYFDAVVLDPPYASRSGSPIKSSIDRGYNNEKRVKELGIFGVSAMMDYYNDGIREAMRITKKNGVIVVKCMDEIMGGKQHLNHVTIINHWTNEGLIVEDFFVLVQKGTPTMRHPYQLHARKNHSYYIVFRKV